MQPNYFTNNKRETLKGTSILLSFLLLSTISFAHWNSKGPYGGSVKCFAVVDTNVYAGSPTGGVFRSTTSKITAWKSVANGLTSGKINTLSSIGTTVIAGSADQGFYLSNDLGANWTQRNNGLSDKNIQALLVSGINIFAGTTNGIFLSTDTGKTWFNTGLVNTSIAALAISGSDIYAGTNKGILVSTDNGSSWTAINSGLVNTNVTSLAISGITIFAGTKGGLYSANTASDAASFNWSNADTTFTNKTINGLVVAEGALYLATNSGIYTHPGATHWNTDNSELQTDSVNTIAFYNTKLIAGTQEKGVFTSNAGSVTWAATNSGFNNLQTYSLFASGSMIITTTNNGVYVSKDLATTYKLSNTGLTDSLNVTSLAFALSKLYASTKNAGVFVSADTGKTWTPANTGLTNLSIKKIHCTAGEIFAGTSDGRVFITSTPNISWSEISTGLPSGIDINSFAIDGHTYFLGTYAHGIFRSYHHGAWVAANTGLSNQNITALVLSGSYLYAGTAGGGVFSSSLTTPSWTAKNAGLPDLNIQSLAVTGKYVLAGCKGGVYATSDTGNNWQGTNTFLNIPTYADVTAISFTDTRIFVNTRDNSVYSNAMAELPSGIFGRHFIDNTTLIISPNPNNGTFRIDGNALNNRVSGISIYDLSGRLLEHFENPYEQKISVNYSRGIYFVQVKTEQRTMTKKMVVE